jgi:hypothetical protein
VNLTRPSSDEVVTEAGLGIDALRSKLPPGERGTLETNHGALTLNYDDKMYSEFDYYIEGNSMLLSRRPTLL